MIQVTKKELTERTFIPYELTITINSKADHDELKCSIADFHNLNRSHWIRFRRSSTALSKLTEAILNHLP